MFRVRRHLDPDKRAIRAAKPKQVVGCGTIALEPLEKCVARLGVGKSVDLERTDVLLRRIS